MASSASTNFDLTCTEIIEAALRKCGALAKGETAPNEDVADAREALNVMVKAWQNRGVRLWTREWKIKQFSASSVVTNGGTTYTCIRTHVADAASEPGTGTNWQLYWLAEGTGGSAWALTTSYTSLMDFDVSTTDGSEVISIDKAFRRDSSGSDHPVDIISFEEYLNIGNKNSVGTITSITLERKRTPRIYVYQPTNDTTDTLHYLAVEKLEDFDAGGNNPDFPSRWLSALIYGLAAEIAPEYEIGARKLSGLVAKAEMEFMLAKGEDIEQTTDDFVRSSYVNRRK